ncbi:MAG: hypothetical protein KTR30_01330 [Saprospiraceae bacterium]|nr:hypothetical protein [Saprospiraceae bacterium]
MKEASPLLIVKFGTTSLCEPSSLNIILFHRRLRSKNKVSGHLLPMGPSFI